jgi:hypothetical protein
MRKFVISLAAAASTLAFAAPASAQWVPPVYRYQPYNFGYGFSGINFARAMEGRVQRIRGDIRAMEFRRILGRAEARSLDNQARNLQRRIYRASRFGINPIEARSVEIGIRRLEVRVAREAADWDRRPGYRRY